MKGSNSKVYLTNFYIPGEADGISRHQYSHSPVFLYPILSPILAFRPLVLFFYSILSYVRVTLVSLEFLRGTKDSLKSIRAPFS